MFKRYTLLFFENLRTYFKILNKIMKIIKIVIIKKILLNVLSFLKTGNIKKKINLLIRLSIIPFMFIIQIYQILINPRDLYQLVFFFLFLCKIIIDYIQKR
jgi:hypothetical protein